MKIRATKILLILVLFLIPALGSAEVENESGSRQCKKMADTAKIEFAAVQRDIAKAVSFNDIGCAMLWRNKQCTSTQFAFDGSTKVYDFQSKEEMPIDVAHFVQATNVISPGAYNIVAFKKLEDAKQFLGKDGAQKIMNYDDLLDLELAK